MTERNSPVGCQVLVASVAFTAGPSGIGDGAIVALRLPGNWQTPQSISSINPPPPGQLHVSATVPYTIDFNPTSAAGQTLGQNWITFKPSGANLTPGQPVVFTYSGFPGGGPASVGPQVFAFKTQGSSQGNLEPIAAQPSVDLIAGQARSVAFFPQTPITVGPLQTSSTMQIVVMDNCGNSTTTESNLDVDLMAGQYGAPDPTAVFYEEGGAVLSSFRTTVSTGSGSSPGFYYVTASAGGSQHLIATASVNGQFAFGGRFVNILNSAVSLTGVSVDTGTLAVFCGHDDGQLLCQRRCRPLHANPSLRWEVIISARHDVLSNRASLRRGQPCAR